MSSIDKETWEDMQNYIFWCQRNELAPVTDGPYNDPRLESFDKPPVYDETEKGEKFQHIDSIKMNKSHMSNFYTEELIDFILDNLFMKRYGEPIGDPDWEPDIKTLMQLKGYVEAAIQEKKDE